jgi:hypothetical protein
MPTNSPGGEDGFAALERALYWRSEGPLPWKSFAAGVGLHVMFVTVYLSGGPAGAAQAVDSPPVARAVPLFNGARMEYQLTRRVQAPVLWPNLQEPAAPRARPDFADVNVDLSTIRLSFDPDLRNELPQVVQDQRGMFALLDKEDRTITHYLLRPPAFQAQEKMADVSGDLRILMDPPQKWPVFRNVARQSGIDLGNYQACAIFGPGFRRCLKDAIAARASTEGEGLRRVASARIAIAAAQPCGIEVREVSFARP